MSDLFESDTAFEDEVRRLARLLWPSAEFCGATLAEGRERDGVFETDDFIHIVECTTSRKKQKAEEDFQKIEKLMRRLGAKRPEKHVKGWFVTLHEPTADQREVFKKKEKRIIALSFVQFRSRLVDAHSYLGARDNYPFGSVRDPETGNASANIDYVPLDILDKSGRLYSVEDMAHGLQSGQRFLVLGDYGAGKSATLLQVFRRLAKDFYSAGTLMFPLSINLRDHHGQTDPVEAIERHARRVGFPKPSDLVRGWRAGLGILLLDGFDEIATAGWAGRTKSLKDLRYQSMELLRKFLRETPQSTGVLLAGRAHFFDGENEMSRALGLGSRFTVLDINQFNDEQIAQYLGKIGWTKAIPEWVPSRPLLLGYLASHDLLRHTLEVEAGSGPAAGWNELLKRICEREAEIEAGIDPETVRRLIEHLATLARSSADGLGPLTPDQITGAFTEVCGYLPDDRGAVLLQRLPGLGGYRSEDGARVFIDRDFAEAACGGEVFTYIENPYGRVYKNLDSWQTTLSTLGAEVAAYRFHIRGYELGKLTAALERAAELARGETLCADIFLVLRVLNIGYDGSNIYIRGVLIPEIGFESDVKGFRPIELQDCIVGRCELPHDVSDDQLPRFLRCHFGVIEGRAGPQDLPPEVFVSCTVDEFENPAQTTNAILSLSLPLGSRVLLTILKKLYAQRGSGRRESALYRGLDPRAQAVVPVCLDLLKKFGFAGESRQGDQAIWLPTKAADARKRAYSILAAPVSSEDPVVLASRDL